MQSFVRNALRAAIFSGACWTAGVAMAAEEDLLPPAAESDPLAAEPANADSDPPPLDGEQALPSAPIDVVVKKRQTGRFMFGAGVNSNSGLQAEVQPSADRNEPVIESAPELFEASPEVLEFTRKLNEQLEISGAPKPSKPRAGWSTGLRLEICPGNCPICGTPVKAAEDFTIGGPPGAPARKRPANWLFQEVDVEHLQGDKPSEGEEKLRPGEPAQVILDLRERLGASALEGSEFTVKPDALAKLIRALDRESRQQEPSPEPAVSASEPASPAWSYGPAPSSFADDEATISALRAASRQLDEAAELLEQQNLFERADELRDQADGLRRDARGFLKERRVPQPPDSEQASSAPPTIDPSDNEFKILQAAAAEPMPAEFTTFLRSAGIKGRSPSARAGLSPEITQKLEQYLGELGQIREAIDQMIGKPYSAGVSFGSAPLDR